MKINIGGMERGIRIVVGLVLVLLAATGTIGWWGWIGLATLTTGAVGWCPPYALMGINTCRVKDAPKA